MAPIVAAPDDAVVLASVVRHRGSVRVALVGLLVVAFLAVLASRPPADHQPGALLVPTPSPQATSVATATVPPTVSPAATPAALRTVATTIQPTEAPTQPPATVPPVIYTVVSGDTLSGIAGRYGTTVHAIMDLNALTTTNLRIGQQLKIPQGTPAPPSLGPAP